MRSIAERVGMVAGAAVVVMALGGAGAVGLTALQGGASDEELIDRLVAIEEQLPTLPPTEVIIDPEQTWAEFSGDFTGAQVALDTVADEARDLYISAEESGGVVAEAVADAARALLVMREGYTQLAAWETNDLAFPLDSADDGGVSTGADELYGAAEVGLALVLDARERSLPAYALLRDAEAADDAERRFLEDRYQAALDFDRTTKPDIHRALSYDTTQVMVTVSRFVTTAPGVEPRAKVMRVVCIDREAYSTAEVVPGDQAGLAALLTDPADDCPAIDNGNEVRLIER